MVNGDIEICYDDIGVKTFVFSPLAQVPPLVIQVVRVSAKKVFSG